MRALRAVWRLSRIALHVGHGLLLVRLVFPWLGRERRRERIRWWAGRTLRLLGLSLQMQGRFRAGGKMIVANHVSWLDILVLHAVCPEARFVSKAEVHHWPLLGRLVDAAETLYIERERKRDALRVVHRSAAAMRDGDTVAVFPEGTTGDGRQLLPFHANLLQAAIATATPVQPVALRVADRVHRISPSALWVGDTTLTRSLWLLATGDGLVAHLHVLAARSSAGADRRALAETLRTDIDSALAGIDRRHRPT